MNWRSSARFVPWHTPKRRNTGPSDGWEASHGFACVYLGFTLTPRKRAVHKLSVSRSAAALDVKLFRGSHRDLNIGDTRGASPVSVFIVAL